jgi:hypothetical protein
VTGLRVVGPPAAVELACPPDRSNEGHGPVVTLGDADPRAVGGRPWVRWLEAPGPSKPGAIDIAPAGDGLWRRAPWPAADGLDEIGPAPPNGPVAVAGGDATRRGELAYALAQRELPVVETEQLDRAVLERASAVLLFPAPGAEEALPAQAPPVLASRRLLVTPAAEVNFGFLPGIDHLEFTLYWEAVEQLAAARTDPASVESIVAWGALAARRHRASRVFADLEADLGVLAP